VQVLTQVPLTALMKGAQAVQMLDGQLTQLGSEHVLQVPLAKKVFDGHEVAHWSLFELSVKAITPDEHWRHSPFVHTSHPDAQGTQVPAS